MLDFQTQLQPLNSKQCSNSAVSLSWKTMALIPLKAFSVRKTLPTDLLTQHRSTCQIRLPRDPDPDAGRTNSDNPEADHPSIAPAQGPDENSLYS